MFRLSKGGIFMDLSELDKNVHEIASTNENDFISHSFLVLLNVHVRDEMTTPKG
jgi:hypothetical protein